MTGLYIFGAVIIVSVVVLLILRARWGNMANMEVKLREANIEKEKIEEAAGKITGE